MCRSEKFTSVCLMLNMSEVWTRLSLTVQQTVTVVLASVFPGILVALRQSHHCFAAILYDVLVQNCIFCCSCYKDQVQVKTGHWTWHRPMRIFITDITTFGLLKWTLYKNTAGVYFRWLFNFWNRLFQYVNYF